MAYQLARVQTRDRIVGGTVIGVREEYRRLIPDRAGEFRIPPLTVQWWDTGRKQPAATSLPMQILQIGPPRAGRSAVDGPWIPSGATPAGAAGEETKRWPRYALSLLLALLSSVAGWYLLPPVTKFHRRWHNCREAVRQFRRACSSGNTEEARRALLKWAADHGMEQCRTLPELADKLESSGARSALQQLDRTLYGSMPHATWGGRRLSGHYCPSWIASPGVAKRNGHPR